MEESKTIQASTKTPLRDILPLPEDTALLYFAQICLTVRHYKQMGTCLANICVENIAVDGKQQLASIQTSELCTIDEGLGAIQIGILLQEMLQYDSKINAPVKELINSLIEEDQQKRPNINQVLKIPIILEKLYHLLSLLKMDLMFPIILKCNLQILVWLSQPSLGIRCLKAISSTLIYQTSLLMQ
ncbi:hypothetical protein FGO68_gene13736 [Halteria grandinella]|uniref:Uncharacterized protein n=1 Tax=Halteria grandinella TaxID=5974 RepID=A0A8J8T270_HALGN|nr:hypothetical protein FGO68_gene13736 [Halteria grandinella]